MASEATEAPVIRGGNAVVPLSVGLPRDGIRRSSRLKNNSTKTHGEERQRPRRKKERERERGALFLLSLALSLIPPLLLSLSRLHVLLSLPPLSSPGSTTAARAREVHARSEWSNQKSSCLFLFRPVCRLCLGCDMVDGNVTITITTPKVLQLQPGFKEPVSDPKNKTKPKKKKKKKEKG